MSRLGKLPPLHSIGRVQNFDFDEPPDEADDSDVDNLIQEYENIEKGYHYDPSHCQGAAAAFGRSFKVLQPGNHISKRSAEGASSFSHCKEGVKFAEKYYQLRQLLETKAKLNFMKEYCSKITQCTLLVRQVEGLVQEEHLTWHAICRNNFQSPPATKLESLGAMCEDLRVNMHHWNSLKQLVHTNQWLRSQLSCLCVELEQVQNKLLYLRGCVIWWLERLIHLGFRVLAHCDPNHLSEDTLWSITRGLEEYNSIVTALKSQNVQAPSVGDRHRMTPGKLSSPSTARSFPSAVHINSHKNLIDSVKTVPFSKVLSWLAGERSKYAAAMTHQFFTSNNQFLMRVRSGRLPLYTWGEEKGGKLRPPSAQESSDYFTQSGSNASFDSAMLRVGTVTAPDLSKEDAPIVEFSSRELEFAIKFLQIVNSSTKLIKRPAQTVAQKRTSVGFAGASTPSLTDGRSSITKSKSDYLSYQTDIQAEEDNLSLASDASYCSSTRKSVSWCDASDINFLRKLADKYMKQFWQFYGQELPGFFEAPILRGPTFARTQLGNVMLCSDMILMIVATMIQQTCLKDIFPAGAEQPLIALSQSLLASSAIAAWDQCYCGALASRMTDKCQPTPLQDGTYSTTTARHLRDAYQPLHSWLVSLQLPKHTADPTEVSPSRKNKGALDPDTSAKLQGLETVFKHYLSTSVLASQWCRTKIDQALVQDSTATFLLLTLSDLKLICDEISFTLRYSQPACAVFNDNPEVNDRWSQLNDLNAQLQVLSGSAVKRFSTSCNSQAAEFFHENMPTGKVWRKKNMQDLPTQHNEYIQNAVGTVLSPVLGGISKLPATSQISAVSMAVTAFCDAWTAHILKSKIRFSYVGAHQLSLDAAFVRQWLKDCLHNEHVRHSVLALDVFKHIAKVIELLLQQPHTDNGKVGKSNAVSHCDQRPERDTDNTSIQALEEMSTESRNNRKVTNSLHSTSKHSFELTPVTRTTRVKLHCESLDNGSFDNDFKISNPEQWLSLRVQGGSRGWPKWSNCFQSG